VTRTLKVTARCDGERPFAPDGKGQTYRPGQFTPCGKSLEGRSHREISTNILRCGWEELADGTLKCDECLHLERTGKPVQFTKKKAG